MSAPGEPRPGRRSSGTLGIVGIFAAVCPPVTGLAFLGLVALAEMAAQRFPSLQYRELVWFGLLYGIIFDYFVFVLPAALAGYVIARLQAANGRVRWWAALAIGVIAGAALQFGLGGGLYAGRDSEAYVPGQELIPTAAFAIAIMVCWAIVRNRNVAPSATGAPR